MKRPFLIWLLLLQVSVTGLSQAITASELLDKSIAYHDPEGHWGSLEADLEILATRPGGADRMSYIHMEQDRSLFRICVEQDGVTKKYALAGDHCELRYMGETSFSESIAASENLTCDRARMLRDYYSYLYGLPMKLRDPGTQLQPGVERVRFHGKAYLALEATYDPETGLDTWIFYFDPQTYALGAYRFYHDRSKNDGEYILLEGEARLGGMRLPKLRKWYRNDTGEFLGADLLEAGRQVHLH
ncbi:DUF6503 family protein [Robiginitalea sp. SC105]|uniref:DUF6503 family protein n=1 Tax=Robiginitalea sp. SC105 TaxID=2762332 RepID=UPI001639DDC4|nr:DUF6503 family protein [Robiginitalea sp. SC105]MBC2838408.1 hypothetical protein [Robiginitalea sp. SC105]